MTWQRLVAFYSGAKSVPLLANKAWMKRRNPSEGDSQPPSKKRSVSYVTFSRWKKEFDGQCPGLNVISDTVYGGAKRTVIKLKCIMKLEYFYYKKDKKRTKICKLVFHSFTLTVLFEVEPHKAS